MADSLIAYRGNECYIVTISSTTVTVEPHDTKPEFTVYTALAHVVQVKARVYLLRKNYGSRLASLMQFFADEGFIIRHAHDEDFVLLENTYEQK